MLLHCVSLVVSLAFTAEPSSPQNLSSEEKTEVPASASESPNGEENSLIDPVIRAVQAAERAALAAEKAAEAAQRIAQKQDQPPPEDDSSETVEKKKLKKASANWTGSAGISLLALFGSANSITVQTSVNAARETKNWIGKFSAAGTYGQTEVQPATPEQSAKTKTVAEDAQVSLRGDYRFSMQYSGFILVGLDVDHIQSIEARPYEESGLSIIWLDMMKGDFTKARIVTDLAFRYGKEFRFQYYDSSGNEVNKNEDNVAIVAPSFRANLRYALDENVILTQEVDVATTVVEKTRTLANSKTKLTARLIASLGVAITFNVNYDSKPAAGKQSRTSTLSFGLETSF